MRNLTQAVSISLLLISISNAATLDGSSLALKSDGVSSGSAWVLDRNGYVGTYVTLPQAGTITIDVSADGAGGAAMGLAVADSKSIFATTPGSKTYSANFNLSAGTHFVRTELSNDRGVSSRSLKINSLSVTGATLVNSHTNANALAASDTYIANYRKGPASVRLPITTANQQVSISLKRSAFNWGAGVDVTSLGTQGTTRQRVYQQLLNQNFNEIVCQCHWQSTEPTPGNVQIGELDAIRDYAAAHNMHTRLHSLIWNGNQPDWVDSLRAAAVSNPSSKSQLFDAIESRIGYYVGGTGYDEVDVYNESYNDGVLEGSPNQYWQLYGAAGVAKLYQDAGAASPSSKMFVNDFAVLQGSSNGFNEHIDTIQQAGVDADYGNVVDGIGLQFYAPDVSSDLGKEVIFGLQNMNVQGLPTVLTEFGTFSSVSDADSVNVLGQLMRLIFGNPSSTGFVMWDWLKEDGGNMQFAPGAALYSVNTSNWNGATLTNAGKLWQDTLGIEDWDGNTANGWNMQLTTTVGPDGTINFNGFYGDYEISVGGKTYDLALTKGVTNYVLGDPTVLLGDYNGDGRVDAADYSVWRNHLNTTFDLHGNGNEEGSSAGRVDQADYQLWKANFGNASGSGSAVGAGLPEPGALTLFGWVFAVLGLRKSRPARPA
jgi:endo-1,4-beta-xylanase